MSRVMLLLFALFLFQQSWAAVSGSVHSTRSDHTALRASQDSYERLSVSVGKNQHKVVHFVADVSFFITSERIQTITVAEPTVTLDFVPLKFHLVYTQFTSTYL